MYDLIIIKDQLKIQRKTEDGQYYTNKAITRYDVILNKEPKTLWFFNSLDLKTIRDSLGGPITVTGVKNYFCQKENHLVFSKNSKLGLLVQSLDGNEATYESNGIRHHILILKKTIYNPFTYHNDAKDIQLFDLESDKEYRFHRLKSFSEAIESKSILGEHRQVKDFVRVSNEMRYQSTLDGKQNLIKASHTFDGKILIIEGGPGTGKTTSLIHRIKYLTDSVVLKEISQIENLQLKWIFLSPSPNLSKFLKKSMELENLDVNNNTVSIWKDKCLKAAKELEILTDQNNIGFFEYKIADKTLFMFIPEKYSELPKQIENQFDQYLINDIKSRIYKIGNNPTIKKSLLGKKVITFISRFDLNSMKSLINMFNGLYLNYYKQVLDETSEVNNQINVLSTQLYEVVRWNTEILDELSNIKDAKDLEEDETEDLKLEISVTEIKNYINKVVIEIYKHGQVKTKTLKKLYNLLKDKIEVDEVLKSKILLRSDLIFLTKGPFALLFKILNQKYFLFRKSLALSSDIFRNEYRQEIANHKILHFEEICFLLGYHLKLFKTLSSTVRITDSKYNEYSNKIDDITYHVIGVDECTDYSVFDMYAINSLLKNGEFTSLTMCGDLMQRMTKTGINNWTDLDTIFSNNLAISTLNQSYRQSATLITLAKNVYKNVQGTNLNLVPKFEKFDDEPEPLIFVNNDYKSRVNWVYQKIKEIKEVYYEEFPSVAIFVPSENEIHPFLEQINSFEKIEGIDFVNGEIPNNKIDNVVNIYDISKIKGLEFHAAYIFDLDTIKDKFGDDIVNRSIYVALSRAAFYLGVTLSNPLEFLKSFGFVEN